LNWINIGEELFSLMEIRKRERGHNKTIVSPELTTWDPLVADSVGQQGFAA